MRFEASIEKDGKKVFEARGDRNIGEILKGLDEAIKKEIARGK